MLANAVPCSGPPAARLPTPLACPSEKPPSTQDRMTDTTWAGRAGGVGGAARWWWGGWRAEGVLAGKLGRGSRLHPPGPAPPHLATVHGPRPHAARAVPHRQRVRAEEDEVRGAQREPRQQALPLAQLRARRAGVAGGRRRGRLSAVSHSRRSPRLAWACRRKAPAAAHLHGGCQGGSIRPQHRLLPALRRHRAHAGQRLAGDGARPAVRLAGAGLRGKAGQEQQPACSAAASFLPPAVCTLRQRTVEHTPWQASASARARAPAGGR